MITEYRTIVPLILIIKLTYDGGLETTYKMKCGLKVIRTVKINPREAVFSMCTATIKSCFLCTVTRRSILCYISVKAMMIFSKLHEIPQMVGK